MGKKNKQTHAIEEDDNFGIPKGLVAQRREELLAAKEQSRLRAASLNTTPLNATPLYSILPGANAVSNNPIPLNTTPINALPPSKASLTHLTKSRPRIEHRNPSQRKSNSLSHDFFKKNEQKSCESTGIGLTKDWLNVLKITIGKAQTAYKKYYELGINTRQPNGWLSWLRHGPDGQKKADSIKTKAEASQSIDIILQQLEQFFEDPDTRYENHSFASYLFVEFNRLLQGNKYKAKPQEETLYDKNDWYKIVEQLRPLMTEEEYEYSSNVLKL